MDGYELTDRGKITVAVVIAVILIALAAILMVKALAARSQPDEQDPTVSGTSPPAIVETTPPEIADSPPPTGGGLIPPESTPEQSPDATPEQSPGSATEPSPGSTPDPSPDATPEQSPGSTPDPSPSAAPPTQNDTHEGPPPSPNSVNSSGSVDPSRGTLSFRFSPESQNTLDNETTAMLGAFLGSPKNTRDSYVIIEIPKLSDEDTERLVAAVVSAFAAQGVSDQRLSFSRNPASASAGAFDVSIYYLARQGK